MDEWEIGKSYYLEGDKPGWFVYKGGDPSKDASWSRATSGGAPARSATSDFLRMAAQSATFGFADEMSGDPEASRARVEQIRNDRPGVALAGTVAGMIPMAVAPVGVAAQGVARGAGLLGTMARGAITGAVEGGLVGAGEADNGNRALAAGVGAGVGGVTGGVMGGLTGAATALARRAAGRGSRVAQALQDATGLRGDATEARQVAGDAVDAVRAAHYGPLEQAFPRINHRPLVDLLRSPDVISHTRSVAADVAAGRRPPSFQEAQEVFRQLKKVGKTSPAHAQYAKNLEVVLEKAVPGFTDANRAYAQAVALNASLQNGRRMWNGHSADIEQAMRGLAPEARDQFRRGQLVEIVRRLEQRNEGNSSAGVLRRYMDAGPETERVLRTMFDDPAKYTEFRRVLQREHSADRILAALRRLAPAAAVGLGLGAGSGAVSALGQ